jgi:hypothetical protein
MAAFKSLKARECTRKAMKKKPSAAEAKADDDDASGDDDDGSETEHPPDMKSKGVLLKRPGSIGFRYVVPDVTKHTLKNTTWPIFGSKVYHESKKAAKNAGLSLDEAASASRQYYGVARGKWVSAGRTPSFAKVIKKPSQAKGAKPAKGSKPAHAKKAKAAKN